MVVRLTDEEMERCRIFAETSLPGMQAIEFGQTDTAPRGRAEMVHDGAVGKMGEIAVSRFLRERYKLHCPVDFGIDPAGECDDNDLQIKAWSVDVKTTVRGKWLLFDADKFRMRVRSGTVPDAIIGCRASGADIDIAGAITTAALLRLRTLKKGECIPGTDCRLQAENIGVPLDRLNSQWDTIIAQMVTTVPYKVCIIERWR
jgi:hypothetical protein